MEKPIDSQRATGAIAISDDRTGSFVIQDAEGSSADYGERAGNTLGSAPAVIEKAWRCPAPPIMAAAGTSTLWQLKLQPADLIVLFGMQEDFKRHEYWQLVDLHSSLTPTGSMATTEGAVQSGIILDPARNVPTNVDEALRALIANPDSPIMTGRAPLDITWHFKGVRGNDWKFTKSRPELSLTGYGTIAVAARVPPAAGSAITLAHTIIGRFRFAHPTVDSTDVIKTVQVEIKSVNSLAYNAESVPSLAMAFTTTVTDLTGHLDMSLAPSMLVKAVATLSGGETAQVIETLFVPMGSQKTTIDSDGKGLLLAPLRPVNNPIIDDMSAATFTLLNAADYVGNWELTYPAVNRYRQSSDDVQAVVSAFPQSTVFRVAAEANYHKWLLNRALSQARGPRSVPLDSQ